MYFKCYFITHEQATAHRWLNTPLFRKQQLYIHTVLKIFTLDILVCCTGMGFAIYLWHTIFTNILLSWALKQVAIYQNGSMTFLIKAGWRIYASFHCVTIGSDKIQNMILNMPPVKLWYTFHILDIHVSRFSATIYPTVANFWQPEILSFYWCSTYAIPWIIS